jgi:hypothetical protein
VSFVTAAEMSLPGCGKTPIKAGFRRARVYRLRKN